MMLFAESSLDAWIGPILTSVAGLAATIIAWLTARDKMRFDAERVKMLADIQYLQQENLDCHDNHRSLQAEFSELRSEVARRGFKSNPPEAVKAAVEQARADAAQTKETPK